MKEAELIEACRKLDRKAQKLLYEQYDAAMFRVVFRYVRDRQDAEDVLLKAFFKVFSHLNQFESRGEGSLNAWIRRIVVNESLMFLRKQPFDWVPVEEAHTEYSDAQADINLNAEDIIREVRNLAPGFRAVFNLYAIEGYTHPEIAEMLGISEGTSKSQLSRARQILREKLTQIHESV
jgi:RNA polymerase sigma-70 factor (ECF subfamily)